MAEKGRLKIQCYVNGTYIPVDGTKIFLRPADGESGKSKEIELSTNSSGESQVEIGRAHV